MREGEGEIRVEDDGSGRGRTMVVALIGEGFNPVGGALNREGRTTVGMMA